MDKSKIYRKQGLSASYQCVDNACLVFSFGFVAAYLFGLD